MKLGTIAFPSRKGGERKPHPVNTAALAIVSELRPEMRSRYLFSMDNNPNRHIRRETLENAWQRIRYHADIDDVRLHDLRHTVGTLAGRAGGNAFLIRDVLRHRNIAMTGRYVNADADPIRVMSDAVGALIEAGLRGDNSSAEVVPFEQRK